MSRASRMNGVKTALSFARDLAEHTKQVHQGAVFHIDRADFEYLWYATPFERTAAADALEESNWSTVVDDLTDRFPQSIEVHSFGHFACGWFERLYVHRDDPAAILAVKDWLDRLQEYGVLDEDDYCQREWDRNHPSDDECYSGDPDCPCAARHESA